MRGRGGWSVARAGWGPAGVAFAASIGLHVLWVASAPQRWAAFERQPPGAAIELETVNLPPAAPELPEPPAAAEPPAQLMPSPPSVARVQRPRAPRALGSKAAVAAPNGPFEPVTAPPVAGEAAPVSPSAAAPALAFSPRQAASSLLQPPGGEMERVSESRPAICVPSEAVAADSCETDEASSLAPERLQRSLEASARTLRHLAPRPSPRLRRQNDGSYRYQGISFNAHVERSGHVSFEEVKGSVALGPLGIGGWFDLTDTIEHGLLGKERYSSEKRWFLEQTAALRAELAESAREAEGMAARRALELELERIVSDAATDPEQKRAQVFALWQECGDDAQARQTQRAVETFVRRRMPQGSRLGYSEDALRRLNEARVGLRAFSPYLAAALDTPG